MTSSFGIASPCMYLGFSYVVVRLVIFPSAVEVSSLSCKQRRSIKLAIWSSEYSFSMPYIYINLHTFQFIGIIQTDWWMMCHYCCFILKNVIIIQRSHNVVKIHRTVKCFEWFSWLGQNLTPIWYRLYQYLWVYTFKGDMLYGNTVYTRMFVSYAFIKSASQSIKNQPWSNSTTFITQIIIPSDSVSKC